MIMLRNQYSEALGFLSVNHGNVTVSTNVVYIEWGL